MRRSNRRRHWRQSIYDMSDSCGFWSRGHGQGSAGADRGCRYGGRAVKAHFADGARVLGAVVRVVRDSVGLLKRRGGSLGVEGMYS
jgi:hypothetical protein